MIAIYVILGVLALGIVVLAAMVGELAARIAALQPQNVSTVQPLTSVTTGKVVSSWPGAAAESESYTVLVLSTICGTCDQVARDLSSFTDRESDVRICLSTPHRDAAAAFVEKHGLFAEEVYVDEDGSWARQSLGVEVSPSLVDIVEGRLMNAYAFEKISDVLPLIGEDRSEVTSP